MRGDGSERSSGMIGGRDRTNVNSRFAATLWLASGAETSTAAV